MELIAACQLEDDGMVEVDEGDIAPGFERPGFDAMLDALVVLHGTDVVAWAEFYRGRAEADVRPSHRSRGIGTALLAWTE
ncbi:MAG TPA: GNAT family N-acetyltransferase, partial [Actinomycetota bacterium]|nr:GNAT family N-acetyltransferase [Actinomycetota bacterium]